MDERRKSVKGSGADPKKATAPPKTLGRKRDPQRESDILEAAMHLLAEIGFDTMTMDMVAARAKAGKATLYRRWTSKEELVRDALIGMSRNSIEVDQLPDSGNLRDDLLAIVKPASVEYSERKLRVLAGLGSFTTQHPKLYDEALKGIFDPWIGVNKTLMKRAMKRRELPADADIDLACEVIVAMTTFKTVSQRKPFDRRTYEALLDRILLPGLKSKRAPQTKSLDR